MIICSQVWVCLRCDIWIYWQLVEKAFWPNLNTFVVCAVVLGLSEDGQKTSHGHLMIEDVFAVIVTHVYVEKRTFFSRQNTSPSTKFDFCQVDSNKFTLCSWRIGFQRVRIRGPGWSLRIDKLFFKNFLTNNNSLSFFRVMHWPRRRSLSRALVTWHFIVDVVLLCCCAPTAVHQLLLLCCCTSCATYVKLCTRVARLNMLKNNQIS